MLEERSERAKDSENNPQPRYFGHSKFVINSGILAENRGEATTMGGRHITLGPRTSGGEDEHPYMMLENIKNVTLTLVKTIEGTESYTKRKDREC